MPQFAWLLFENDILKKDQPEFQQIWSQTAKCLFVFLCASFSKSGNELHVGCFTWYKNIFLGPWEVIVIGNTMVRRKKSSWGVWNLMFWDKHSFPSHHHKRALWAHDSYRRSWCHVCLCVFVHVWIYVSGSKWQVSCVPYGRVRAKLTPRLTTDCGLLVSPTEGKDCVTSTGCWTKTAAKPMGCFSGLLDISVHRLREKVPFQTNSNLLAWGWVRFVNSTLQKWKKIDFFRRTMKQKHKRATYNQTAIDYMLLKQHEHGSI